MLCSSVTPRLHQDTCCRIQVVSTCCRQRVSCIGNKIVASLSPVCCWIQRDTSRPWHKWIVIMSPRYSQYVNMYPERATCIRRHVSWCRHGIILAVAVQRVLRPETSQTRLWTLRRRHLQLVSLGQRWRTAASADTSSRTWWGSRRLSARRATSGTKHSLLVMVSYSLAVHQKKISRYEGQWYSSNPNSNWYWNDWYQ